VVDGCSDDDTVEIARKFGAMVISDEGTGLAAARQLGAEVASGDFIIFMDADVELPTPGIMDRLLAEKQKRGWAGIHAKIHDPSPETYWAKGENFHWAWAFNRTGPRQFIGTLLALVDRNVVLDVRFDPAFRGASEDYDFWLRVRKAGHTIGVGSSYAYHHHRSSFKEFVRQRKWYGRGNVLMARKTGSLYRWIAPLPILAVGTLQCVVRFRPQFIPFYLVWAYALAVGTLQGVMGARRD